MEKIKIKDLEWQIILVPTTSSNLIVNGNACYGVCNHYEKKIYLDKELPDDQMRRTVVHELTHAFITSYFIERKEHYTEEDLCEFVAIYGEEISNLAKEILKKIKISVDKDTKV